MHLRPIQLLDLTRCLLKVVIVIIVLYINVFYRGTLVLPYSASGDDLKEVYSYTDNDIPILGQYDGSKDLLIQLPPKTSVSDLRYSLSRIKLVVLEYCAAFFTY